MASLLTIEIARGGITGLLTRVMRAAAREHTFDRHDLIALCQSSIHGLRSGWYQGDAVACYHDERDAVRGSGWHARYAPIPFCRGGWPTVTIEEVTFFDAPHST